MTEMQAYYREMVTASLHHIGKPETADVIAEYARGLASQEGHPKKLVAELTSQRVGGVLRSLVKGDAAVRRIDPKKSTRHGRYEPLYSFAGARNHKWPVPHPPIGEEDEECVAGEAITSAQAEALFAGVIRLCDMQIALAKQVEEFREVFYRDAVKAGLVKQ